MTPVLEFKETEEFKKLDVKSEQRSKGLPGWIRPMLIASIGLHALVLLVPLSGRKPQDAEKKPEEEEAVKITQLAPAQPPGAKPSPKASPRPAQPRATPPRQARQTTPPPTRTANRPRPATPATQANNPAPTTPNTTDANPNSGGPAPTADPFASFPRYPGAKAGSGGLFKDSPALDQNSLFTADPLEAVSSYYEAEAAKAGFSITRTTDRSDVRVYEVTKDNQTQYLHLAVGDGVVVILLASTELKISDLKNQRVEVEPPEKRALQTVNDELLDEGYDFSSSDVSMLVEPGAFDGVSGVEIDLGPLFNFQDINTLLSGDEAFSVLAPRLEAKGFTIEEAGTYGGGPLYRVTQNNYIIFLNLPPRVDGAAGIYWWRTNPNQ